MRRIIFLDVDGVLNSTGYLKRVVAGEASKLEVEVEGRIWRHNIDVAAVARLDLLARPGVEWVLSSTWRGDGSDAARAHVGAALRVGGWTGTLLDSTPVLRRSGALGRWAPSIHVDYSRGAQPTRGDEIAAWLAAAGLTSETANLAILDDDPDIAPLEQHWVAINEDVGLGFVDVLRAWSLLDEIVVMVDELLPRPEARLKFFRPGSCHLTVNGESEAHEKELHRVAQEAGLRRSYFQHHRVANHYDLTSSKRAAAIRHGAVEVPGTDQLLGARRRRSS